MALQARLAGDGLAGALDRMLRITSELNVVHHQRALGFEFLKRDAVQPLVRSTLRTSRLIQGGPQGTVELDRTVVRSVLPKLDTDLSEFAYTVNLLDHDGRSWEQVRKQWTQVMYDSARLREALSGESANWPPPEAMENWKEISALPGLRPRTNLKDVDAAVKTALAQPGNTPALQAVLVQATAWRQDNQGSKREFAISELERNVLHRLAGSPEHLARRPPRGWGSQEVGQLPQMPLRTHGTRTGTNSQPQNARYPQPTAAVLEEWSDRIRYAHEYLREAPDGSQLRQQAAEIVAQFHVAPPAESGQLSDEARSYRKLYNSTIDVVAFALGRDRGRTQPTLRANEVAQKMAMDFGSSPEAHIALNQNLQSQAGSVPDPVMPEFVEGSRRHRPQDRLEIIEGSRRNTRTGGSAGVHDASATRRQRRLGGAREAGLDPQVEGWELGRSITVTAPESWMDSFHPQSHNSDELEPPARVPLSAEATPELFAPFTRSYAHSTRSYTYQVGSGGTVVLPNGASLTGRWAALGDDFVNEQGYILYRESGWIGHVANWDALQKILDFDLHGYYLISDSTNLQFIPVTDTQPPVLLPLKEDSAPPRTSSKGTEENTVTGLSAGTPAPHVSQETVKTASQREVGLT
ncbi:hypothetical protein, partial [Actinacidiphila sp. bgisy167]|uniref:hypothetical protein n=1 Tax=Actinacidiphila sp. bgisy167 TaxID=3413797 RepID=UPI003D70D5F7